jgi:hypothetical protein
MIAKMDKRAMAAVVTLRRLVVGIALAGATASAAQQVPEAGQPVPGLECITTGYDLVLVNNGTNSLAAGTLLSWSVRFVRLEGTHLLTADLLPGSAVHLTGALVSTYLGKPKPCVITQVPQQP